MTLPWMNTSCDEHDVGNRPQATRTRWQGGVAGTRSHSQKRAAMARVPLLMTTSDWTLATEDDNHANDGKASLALDRYPCLFFQPKCWVQHIRIRPTVIRSMKRIL